MDIIIGNRKTGTYYITNVCNVTSQLWCDIAEAHFELTRKSEVYLHPGFLMEYGIPAEGPIEPISRESFTIRVKQDDFIKSMSGWKPKRTKTRFPVVCRLRNFDLLMCYGAEEKTTEKTPEKTKK